MTAEETPDDLIARRLAAFEKATQGTDEDEEALPPGVTPENFQSEDEPAEDETETEQPEAAVEEVDDEAKRRAVAALLRSGFDQGEIDAMPVERLLERGLKRHEILARDDDAHRRVRAQEASTKETPASHTEPSAPKPESKGVPEVDFTQAVAPFAEQYGLDEDGAKALAAAFAATVGPVAADVQALKSARESEATKTLETTISSVRSEILSDIDEPTFERVVGRMVALQNDAEFQAIGDLSERVKAVMKASAASLGITASTQGEQPKQRSTARTVRTVKREVSEQRKPEERELTPLDKRYAVYSEISKLPPGATRVEQARKAAGLA